MATTKITTATQRQWDEIAVLRESIIAGITNQPDDEEVRNVVRQMWKDIGGEAKAVLIADCPVVGAIWLAALINADKQLDSQLDSQLHSQLYSQLDSQLYSQLYSQLGSQLHSQLRSQLDSQLYSQLHSQLGSQLYSQLDSQLHSQLRSQLVSQLDSQLYVSVWWRAWSGYYEGGKILGVVFPDELFLKFLKWTTHVPVIYANESIPIVSRFPKSVHWLDGRLHNESGKAVEFRSGWGLWSIEGIAVDEQIVMRPETQTVKQIDSESNADVKSIRINRFGWPRYLQETNSKCIDQRFNEIEGMHEALFAAPNGERRLVVTCPTGRVFAPGVPTEIKSCEQAKKWIHPEGAIILART